MIREGKRSKKWDARRTAQPQTIGVIVNPPFDSPEDALAAWRADRCGLPERINHWDRVMRIEDLVLILRQREARAKNGIVDILTIDMRGEPR